jgi:hypothetical protein
MVKESSHGEHPGKVDWIRRMSIDWNTPTTGSKTRGSGVRLDFLPTLPACLNSEFLIRQENGLAHFRQIDTPHSPTTRRSFRPMGAAHTSPRQRLGNTPCDTRAF